VIRSCLGRAALETIALVVVVIFIFHFVISYPFVYGNGMQPGLHTGDYVLVDKLAYLFHPPKRGDVILFRYPPNPTTYEFKRVIGLPGDTIKYNNTSVWVDGVQLKEPYITTSENHGSSMLKVPPNDYFVMGDNRPAASDSRDWGFVPDSDIVGKVVLVYWPVSDWERINTYDSVYSQIR